VRLGKRAHCEDPDVMHDGTNPECTCESCSNRPSSNKHNKIDTSLSNGSSLIPNGNNNSQQMHDEFTANGLSRVELVRLIEQALHEIGYSKAAEMLEKESGICALSPIVVQFRSAVLNADWNLADKLLPELNAFESDVQQQKARAVLCEQKYLELLESGDSESALNVLQNDLAPLHSTKVVQEACDGSRNRPELHRLTLLLMCRSAEELKERAVWRGSGIESRSEVIHKLQALMRSSVLLPDSRLESLLGNALDIQKQNAMFPYTLQTQPSLLENLSFSKHKLPCKEIAVLTKHSDEVWFVQFSHNGKYLASASKDRTVRIWDTRSVPFQNIAVFNGHTESLSYLSWSPDDSMLLSCGNDRAVCLWELSSSSRKHTLTKHAEGVTCCAWLPDSTQFVTGGTDRNIHLWNADSGSCTHTFVQGGRINDLAITPDGTKMVVLCSEKKITVYNLIERVKVYEIQETENSTSVSMSPDGSLILVNLSSATLPSEIHAWNIHTRKRVMRYCGLKQIRFVIRSCFGGVNSMFVVSGSEDNQIYLWNRQNGELLEVFSGHEATVNSVSWNPQHPALFASASDDRTIRIWGTEDPSLDPIPRMNPPKHESDVEPMTDSPAIASL